MNQLETLSKQSDHCEEQQSYCNKQFQMWQKLHSVLKDTLRLAAKDDALLFNSLDSFLQLSKSQQVDINNQMSSIIPSVQQLNQRFVRDANLTKEWALASRPPNLLNGICGKASTYVIRLKESWQHLLRDRAARGRIQLFDSIVLASVNGVFVYFVSLDLQR